jgi:hypothetical protein
MLTLLAAMLVVCDTPVKAGGGGDSCGPSGAYCNMVCTYLANNYFISAGSCGTTCLINGGGSCDCFCLVGYNCGQFDAAQCTASM